MPIWLASLGELLMKLPLAITFHAFTLLGNWHCQQTDNTSQLFSVGLHVE
jgi:hypothetical protein